MACGALYSSEQETAANMHIAALRLMSEVSESTRHSNSRRVSRSILSTLGLESPYPSLSTCISIQLILYVERGYFPYWNKRE